MSDLGRPRKSGDKKRRIHVSTHLNAEDEAVLLRLCSIYNCTKSDVLKFGLYELERQNRNRF